MPCMNIIKGTCCPHYDEEPERRPTVKKMIMSKKVKNIFAVDGGAALHIKNENIFKSVNSKIIKAGININKKLINTIPSAGIFGSLYFKRFHVRFETSHVFLVPLC